MAGSAKKPAQILAMRGRIMAPGNELWSVQLAEFTARGGVDVARHAEPVLHDDRVAALDPALVARLGARAILVGPLRHVNNVRIAARRPFDPDAGPRSEHGTKAAGRTADGGG